ncbi:hypothetical protein DOY81_005135, partial [Sarcophaga bullata]
TLASFVRMLTLQKLFLLAFALLAFSWTSMVKAQKGITADLGDKRYFIITSQTYNWFKANHVCSSKGMSLASLETETEYKTLKDHLYNKDLLGNGFWLSGNNLDGTSSYTWLSTGNTFSFTKWATGQPDTATTKNCVKTDGSFNWITATCTEDADKAYVICSRPLVPDCGLTGGCKTDPSFFY